MKLALYTTRTIIIGLNVSARLVNFLLSWLKSLPIPFVFYGIILLLNKPLTYFELTIFPSLESILLFLLAILQPELIMYSCIISFLIIFYQQTTEPEKTKNIVYGLFASTASVSLLLASHALTIWASLFALANPIPDAGINSIIALLLLIAFSILLKDLAVNNFGQDGACGLLRKCIQKYRN